MKTFEDIWLMLLLSVSVEGQFWEKALSTSLVMFIGSGSEIVQKVPFLDLLRKLPNFLYQFLNIKFADPVLELNILQG